MRRTLSRRMLPFATLLALLGPACGPQEGQVSGGGAEGTDPGEAFSEAGSQDLTGVRIIPEAWVSPWDTVPNLDSPAFWQGPEGAWVVVTAKGTHELWVFDASTGEMIRKVGSPGSALGEFQYPNGIFITGDLLFVVERDNHRVQLMSLPDFHPLGTFGETELLRPYGIALYGSPRGTMEVFVTDDYGNEEDLPEGEEPSGDFTRRVSLFNVSMDSGMVQGSLVRQFGEAGGPGALSVVESIQVDETQGNLLVADEQDMDLELYDLEGGYQNRVVASGLYRFGDPEGIMLYRCDEAGYWILTEQGKARTVFHILDRNTFELVGSFAGEVTANTDGIWLTQDFVNSLGIGALFALNDDGGLAAFGWDAIADALGLQGGCPLR